MSDENASTTDLQDPSPTEEDRDEITFKRSYFYAALVPVAFVVGIAVGFLFWGRGPEPTSVVIAQAPQEAGPAGSVPDANPAQVRLEVEGDDDPALGPENAPITIIEFSDFHCPYCGRFHHDTFTALMESYPDQIQFIYRDFPVVGGFETSLASECAHEQDSYWSYHDLLFSGRETFTKEGYLAYASELGLDMEAFEACLDEARYAEEVENDARYAVELGITGTPTFFINGIPLVGAQPLEVFKEIIDSELES